jgi:parvulin-like peptidyl-prolyl isomerase
MKSIIKSLLLLFFVFSFFTCKADQSKIIIAKFDSGYVNLKEVIEEYNNLSPDEKSKYNNNDDLFRLVRKIALEKIIISKSKKDGIENEKEFLDKIESSKKNIGYNILKKKNVLDKINITETDYAKYKKTYELYQIVKRTDIPDKSKIAESRKYLEKISKNIKSLDEFKKAASQISDDVTAENEGYVGKIRLGIMEEEIDQVLQRLGTGKISDIVETSIGLHLLFINKIEEVKIDELLKDKSLSEMIYKDKEEKFENQWYESLLTNPSLKINKDDLKNRKPDETIIIQFNNKKITRKEVLETVDKFRQNTFPEPTEEELYNLVKNMAINLVLESLISDGSIIKSTEFNDRAEKEKKFTMVQDYIDKNMKVGTPTDEDINNFYQTNIKTLFTFKLENGKTVIQKIDEVKDFIIQKLQTKYVQDARYNLYRKLVDEDHLKIDDKDLKTVRENIK